MITYKFIFTDTEPAPARHIEHTITGEQTWDELLPLFEDWLRGIGYAFKGDVRVVE